MSFNRSSDRFEPFLGHVTLARARRGQQIPPEFIGVPMNVAWPIREIQLVSSTIGPLGARYAPMLSVKLNG
jgi:2'-5' RNA ligase